VRRSFTLVSIIVHTIAIAGGLYAQILAESSLLPTPHRPIMFDTSQFMPLSIQLPAPPVSHKARAGNATSQNGAPVIAPSGVAPETGNEDNSAPSVGLIAGVDSAPPSSIEGVGVSSAPAPPPPPPVPIAPTRLHSGMTAPVKIADVAPIYPVIARNAHIQGVVILEAVLDIHGRVESVSVLRSLPLLDQAAVDAVRQWRFTPALLNGEAVPVVMTVTVNFTLQDR
jgi:protein TonB